VRGGGRTIAPVAAALVSLAVLPAPATAAPSRSSHLDSGLAAPAGAATRSRVPVGGHPASVVPFTPSPLLRRPTARERLPRLWADGRACSSGCRPRGAVPGWPLRPFDRQHALRAGLNELRTGSLHGGIDVQARNGQRVFAIQPGYARVLRPTGIDAQVQVGAFVYWHVVPTVRDGQWVVPYRTVVGRVRYPAGHLHLTELRGGRELNPLRPGGRVLSPWRDAARPVIGAPRLRPGGAVWVRAYDPQSFVVRTTYPTPVLAPAALAYRLRTARGRPVGPLHWALRGAHVIPYAFAPRLYAPGARGGGWVCFAYHPRCTPNWHYRLAGGLAPALPRLAPGRYRLSVYAWDWAGNTVARDAWLEARPSGAIRPLARPRRAAGSR
jgi:hypothetical protein